MSSPFLYFAHERLSLAELTAACLDGDLVALGEGFLVADAVETPRMRAGSLEVLTSSLVAVGLESAAWVWGARLHPPQRHDLIRLSGRTTVHHPRAMLHDFRTIPLDVVRFDGVVVTNPFRTAYDLVRSSRPAVREQLRSLVRDHGVDPTRLRRACTARSFPGSRAAFAHLDALEREFGSPLRQR